MRHRALALAALPFVSACALIVGLKDREPGDGGSDAASDAGLEATTPCPDSGLATNPNHCGYCGHDCLGGTCDASVCQPVQLAADVNGDTVSAVAVDEASTNVYWASKQIETRDIAGTGTTRVLHTGTTNPTSMAVAGGVVYWVEPGVGGPESVVIADGGYTAFEPSNDPHKLLLSHDRVFWTDATQNSQVRSCDIGSCGGSNDKDVTAGLGNGSTAIALDWPWIYTNNENGIVGITFCDVGTCTSTQVTRMNVNIPVTDLVADDGGVYFTDDSSSVWSCPPHAVCVVDGGAPKNLSGNEASPVNILLDNASGVRRLYWINAGAKLRTCTIGSDCADAMTLRSGNVHGLAMDAVSLYFGEGSNVMRLAKP